MSDFQEFILVFAKGNKKMVLVLSIIALIVVTIVVLLLVKLINFILPFVIGFGIIIGLIYIISVLSGSGQKKSVDIVKKCKAAHSDPGDVQQCIEQGGNI